MSVEGTRASISPLPLSKHTRVCSGFFTKELADSDKTWCITKGIRQIS